MKVLICDPISPKGIALLKERPEFNVVVLEKKHSEADLIPLVSDAAAIIVRSETEISPKVLEAATKLRVVGRAGVGVDNINVEARPQPQVEGIAEDDLRADGVELRGRHRLHRAIGADRHEHRGLHRAMDEFQPAAPGRAVAVTDGKPHLRWRAR